MSELNFDLRDLAQKLRATAREHAAFWQVNDFVMSCCDAIDSVAQVVKLRHQLDRLQIGKIERTVYFCSCGTGYVAVEVARMCAKRAGHAVEKST